MYPRTKAVGNKNAEKYNEHVSRSIPDQSATNKKKEDLGGKQFFWNLRLGVSR